MIRFSCKHCQRFVQVAAKLAGKQGRCPFCKNLVRIPMESDPNAREAQTAGNIERPATDDLLALKWALMDDDMEEPKRPVPPPPQSIQQAEDIQLDFREAQSGKTTELPALRQPRPTVVQPEKRPLPVRHAPPSKSNSSLTWVVFGIGLLVVVMALVLAILIVRRP